MPGGMGWGAPPASGGTYSPPLSGPIVGGIGQKSGNLGLRSLSDPTPAPPPSGGVFGQPFDPAQSYGDPHAWQPSAAPQEVY